MKTLNRPLLRCFAFCVIGIGILLLAACPPPINDTTFTQVTDKTAPTVEINSPADNAPYDQNVDVQGKAIDNGGKLKSLSYVISGTAGTLSSGQIAVETLGVDGSFIFNFGTVSFSGPIAVTVTATDWNDNSAKKAIALTPKGSSISSFTATPANKSVLLQWQTVPDTNGYTVYYTSNGTLPTLNSPQTITIASTETQYTMSGLKNGAMYVFLLQAHTSGGSDYWSSYVKTIPLSPLTLAPVVSGGYHEIDLEWSEMEGTSEFIVLRAGSPSGPFSEYTGTIQGNTYVDTTVADNTWYYYKVKPSLAGTIDSTYNAAQTVPYSPNTDSGIVKVVTPAPAKKVKYSGNYAYVAAGSSGLWVFDVSNPKSPVLSATLSTTNALDLEVSGSSLYLADGAGGLKVVDISNPTSPSLVTGATQTWGASSNATAVSAIPGYIYVIDFQSNGTTNGYVRGYDISTPANPSNPVSYTDTNYYLTDVAATVTGGSRYVYVSGGGDVLKLLHSDTPDLTWVSTYTDPEYFSFKLCVKPSTTSADLIYALGAAPALESPIPYVLVTVNIGTFTKTADTSAFIRKGSFSDLNLNPDGSLLYIADGHGLQSVDVTTSTPVFVDFWDNPGATTGAVSNGSYAFVTTDSLWGFQTVDLTLPKSPSTVGRLADGGGGYDVAVRDGRAFLLVGGTSKRLQPIDITDLANPVSLGTGVSLSSPAAIAISGQYAFVADGMAGLKIIDLSNPLSPAVVGSAPNISGYGMAIAVKGEYCYLAASTGLQIFDVADPAHPFGVGMHDSDGGGIHGVAVRGHFAYLADGAYFQPNSLKIIDVSKPQAPLLVGKSGAPQSMQATSVSLYRDYAFMTDSFPSQGLFAVNINPSSADFLKSYGPCDTLIGGGGDSYGLSVFGNYAYIADSSAGLAIVDVTDPKALNDVSLIMNYAWAASPSAKTVVLSGKYAFIPDSTDGLEIISLY